MSASFSNTPPPPWAVIDAFCRHFNPEHARLAPERGMFLFEGSTLVYKSQGLRVCSDETGERDPTFRFTLRKRAFVPIFISLVLFCSDSSSLIAAGVGDTTVVPPRHSIPAPPIISHHHPSHLRPRTPPPPSINENTTLKFPLIDMCLDPLLPTRHSRSLKPHHRNRHHHSIAGSTLHG